MAVKKGGFCENRVEKRGDLEKMRISGERSKRLEAGTEGQKEKSRGELLRPTTTIFVVFE